MSAAARKTVARQLIEAHLRHSRPRPANQTLGERQNDQLETQGIPTSRSKLRLSSFPFTSRGA